MPTHKKWSYLSPDAVSFAIDKYLSEQEKERGNLLVNHVWDAEIVHQWTLDYASSGVVSSGMGRICLDPFHTPEQITGTEYSYEPYGYSAEAISDYPAELLEIVEGGGAFVDFLRKTDKFDSFRSVLDEGHIIGIETALNKAYLDFGPRG